MNEWGFWEIISDEARIGLFTYQWWRYGIRLDRPVFHWYPGAGRPVKYPTLEECERDMKQKPEHQKRVS